MAASAPLLLRRAGSRRALWFLPLLIVVLVASALAVRTAEPARLELALSFAGPSQARPLGSGAGGIDLGAFVGHACLRVLLLAAIVAIVACLLGAAIGAVAAQRRGRSEQVILRTCDFVQAFPSFLVALAVLAATRVPERWHLGLVFLLTAWAPFARLTHAMGVQIIGSEFVLAARALGAGPVWIAVRHVIPHLVGPLVVQAGACAAGVVLSESSLSFIGLGVSDGISLGAVLEQGTVAMIRDPRILVVAVIAVGSTSGALQLASEGLRAMLIGDARQ